MRLEEKVSVLKARVRGSWRPIRVHVRTDGQGSGQVSLVGRRPGRTTRDHDRSGHEAR
jgi:hypothetical protein